MFDVWKSKPPMAYLLMLMTTLFWGCNVVFAKLAVGEVSPMLLVSIRWMTTTVLLVVIFQKKLKQEIKSISGIRVTFFCWVPQVIQSSPP